MVSVSQAPIFRWVVAPRPDRAAVLQLAERLHLPEALAALLVQRGQTDAEIARRYLRPAIGDLSDPYALAGMAEAVDTVAAAVRAGGTIMVHGDYDVDGQCASAVLTRALRAAGARVTPFVPHRLRDGYDFGAAGVRAAREAGVSLVITCDCGITAVETVQEAKAAGIEVVITDHHLPGAELPDAAAIVDAQQPGDTSGLNALCGTGIAFKLVQALVPALGLPSSLHLHLLDYVALATVADVVPLVGENRILVKHGLRLLSDSRWPGIRALVECCGLTGRDLRAGQLGFILGPRLNAAGRIGDAGDGVRLLLTDDPAEASQLARRLDELNGQRQSLDQRMLEEALTQVEQYADPAHYPALVLSGDAWHPGVVGIVASRIVERYGRPTFLIAFDGDIGKGSGRSISRFDLHDGLGDCADLLERYGGHRMAAGLTIRREHLDEFRERFAAAARARLTPDDLGPEQRVDLVVGLEEVTPDFERLCRYLEPCGTGNPGPVFGVRGARLVGHGRVGANHLKGVLDDGRGRLGAIGFQWADRVPWLAESSGRLDAAFRVEQNVFNGTTSLQARLVALSPCRDG